MKLSKIVCNNGRSSKLEHLRDSLLPWINTFHGDLKMVTICMVAIQARLIEDLKVEWDIIPGGCTGLIQPVDYQPYWKTYRGAKMDKKSANQGDWRKKCLFFLSLFPSGALVPTRHGERDCARCFRATKTSDDPNGTADSFIHDIYVIATLQS
eukprot:scaffold1999_cov153-Amphora_coffeaeformis.AAC.15